MCSMKKSGMDGNKEGKRGIRLAEKRNPYHYDPEYYVHGNTVKKLDVQERRQGHSSKNTAEAGHGKAKAAGRIDRAGKIKTANGEPLPKEAPYRKPARRNLPGREPDRYERLREQENRRDEKKLFHINRSVSFLGILMLCGAMACMVFLCIRYLDIQAEATRLDKAIAGLKDDLGVLVDINAGKEEALVENIDLEAIYQTAVGEFGMVFPNHNEVIYYDTVDFSYVRQYADIPEAAASILDKLVP